MKHRAYYGTLTEDPRSIAEGPGGSDIHYEGDPPGYFYDWEKEMRKEKNGKFKQSGAFFGYGRSADSVVKGVVAGSVAIGPFYTRGGYLDWGLQNIKASDATGLDSSTQYTFHVVIDEFNANGFDSVSTETAIAFTTDSSDTTFNGSGVAVIPKIQARFDALYYDESSGLYNKKVSIKLHNGDIRVTSLSNNSDTIVGIGNVSGTSPFGVGRFPSLSDSVPALKGAEFGGGTTDTIVYGPASTLDLETIDDRTTGKTIPNANAFIYDDGNGQLHHKGAVVGWIDYAKGHCEFNVPNIPKGEFKIHAETLSAHAGGVNFTSNGENSIDTIMARSINPKKNSKVELLLLG